MRGDVLQLFPVHGPAEQQPAAAHVAPGDEIAREPQARAETFEQHFQVLFGGDAAQEDDLRLRPGAPRQPARVAGERAYVRFDILPDLGGGEDPKIVGRDQGLRRQEAAAGGDDQDARAGGRRIGERRGISHLSPEIEAAQEGEKLPQRNPFVPEPEGELETGLPAKDHLRPPPAAMGGGKKEDSAHSLNVTPFKNHSTTPARIPGRGPP